MACSPINNMYIVYIPKTVHVRMTITHNTTQDYGMFFNKQHVCIPKTFSMTITHNTIYDYGIFFNEQHVAMYTEGYQHMLNTFKI